MNKQKNNTSVLTYEEKEQIRTAITNLTNILNKYEVNKHPVINKQIAFNKAFNNILKGSTKRYLNPNTYKPSKKKTTLIQVLNKKGEWLLEYYTNPTWSYFYYNYDRVYTILIGKVSVKDDNIECFMKSIVETKFKLMNTRPETRHHVEQETFYP